MKALRIALVLAFLLDAVAIFGQRPMTAKERKEFMAPPPLRENVRGTKDRNHGAEYLNDKKMTENWFWCYSLNGVFVGPWGIGIDKYAYEEENSTSCKSGLRTPFVVTGIGASNDSLVVGNDKKDGRCYSIRGHGIVGFTNYKSENPVDLLTFDDIRKKYCPNVEGTVLYMVNKFFVLEDTDLYKFADDFIWKVEVLSSADLVPLKDCIEEPFSIIRVFTKTHHNWHPSMVD